MSMAQGQEKKEQKKGFWARLLDGLDKKMEEKASGARSCCCPSAPKSDKKTCC
jgi:hypothetical protein